jgi:hypothetical protein
VTRPSETGAASIEFHLASLLVMLPLLLGILQVTLLCVGYHLLALAAYEAARAGSVDHAQLDSMRHAMAEQLIPLMIDLAQVDSSGGSVEQISTGLARAIEEVALFGEVQRIAPTVQDFSDHARSRDGRRGIPNDALQFRSDAPGPSSGRSVQQANLLRIRLRYCHRLVVPLIDRLLPPFLQILDGDPEHQRCYAAGRIPIRAVSSAPMQSEARP